MYSNGWLQLISYVRIYTYEKREVRLFFTLDKGFAIPAKSRKTTEVHARDIHPTTPLRAWKWIIHTHGTFIVVTTTSYEILRRFQLVANNVNKRLLCLFYRCSRWRLFPALNRLQQMLLSDVAMRHIAQHCFGSPHHKHSVGLCREPRERGSHGFARKCAHVLRP